MRPLIQYDLDEPPTAPSTSLATTQINAPQPPMKKRKRNHHNPQRLPSVPSKRALIQHWDDPGSASVGVAYDDQEDSANPTPIAALVSHADEFDEGEDEYGEGTAEGEEGPVVEEDEEESRELTHEEIWDDSALIDAWNSAEAEYEAYHGTSKAWKTEMVKKSPLWYNKPYTAPTNQPGPSKPKPHSKQVPPQAKLDDEPEPDTAPLDFDTYVPTHDPSLAIPSDTDAGASPAMTNPSFVPPPSTMMVSRDEAFSNALSAMYWSGYWTAVYHCQSQTSGRNNNGSTDTIEEVGIDADEDKDEEDLVPAQR